MENAVCLTLPGHRYHGLRRTQPLSGSRTVRRSEVGPPKGSAQRSLHQEYPGKPSPSNWPRVGWPHSFTTNSNINGPAPTVIIQAHLPASLLGSASIFHQPLHSERLGYVINSLRAPDNERADAFELLTVRYRSHHRHDVPFQPWGRKKPRKSWRPSPPAHLPPDSCFSAGSTPGQLFDARPDTHAFHGRLPGTGALPSWYADELMLAWHSAELHARLMS